jgi:hypothetical protein
MVLKKSQDASRGKSAEIPATFSIDASCRNGEKSLLSTALEELNVATDVFKSHVVAVAIFRSGNAAMARGHLRR